MSAKNVANMCACPWNEGLQGASLTLLWMPTRLSFVQSVASWTKNPCRYVLKLKYFEYTVPCPILVLPTIILQPDLREGHKATRHNLSDDQKARGGFVVDVYIEYTGTGVHRRSSQCGLYYFSLFFFLLKKKTALQGCNSNEI